MPPALIFDLDGTLVDTAPDLMRATNFVLTEMGRTIPEEARTAMLANIPLQRFGEPREIADAILFLSSPMASYITGQTLHVNGGWWG